MAPTKRHIEIAFVAFMFLTGSSFLLKMCYLSLAFNTAFGLSFLAATYAYVRSNHQLAIPPFLLMLVFFAVEVDALGNYFRLYGRDFGPIEYDDFAHVMVQVFITPLIVWLLRRLMHKYGFAIPLSIASLFSGTLMFSLGAGYEIIELWDELYFGGQRIWGTYDTAMDLQWDLAGILLGALLANLVLSFKSKPETSALTLQRFRDQTGPHKGFSDSLR